MFVSYLSYDYEPYLKVASDKELEIVQTNAYPPSKELIFTRSNDDYEPFSYRAYFDLNDSFSFRHQVFIKGTTELIATVVFNKQGSDVHLIVEVESGSSGIKSGQFIL